MLLKVGRKSAEWAHSGVGEKHMEVLKDLMVLAKVEHWSRFFEYPWCMIKGDFKKGQWVLDAAGADGAVQYAITNTGAQVVNVDLDASRLPAPYKGCLMAQSDLLDLKGAQDEVFDRVVCLSVLEHIEGPERVVPQLWRAIKPGGRLLLSIDVATYARHNHTVDEDKAEEILNLFGMTMPMPPPDILTRLLMEEDRKEGEPEKVGLAVLCICADKEVGA